MENQMKCKVVMLSTTNKVDGNSKIVISNQNGKLITGNAVGNSEQNNHLFLVSEDTIKEGDYILDLVLNEVYKPVNIQYSNQTSNEVKIVATTDTTLNLPLIPISFLEAYCKANGKIDEVMIEIEQYPVDMHGNEILWAAKGIQNITAVHSDTCCDNDKEYVASYHKTRVKTRPDNTVIIHRMKTQWTRDEVKHLMYDVMQIALHWKDNPDICSDWIDSKI